MESESEIQIFKKILVDQLGFDEGEAEKLFSKPIKK